MSNTNQSIVDAVIPNAKVKKTMPDRYSPSEDKLILDMVMRYPDNLRHGFREASKKLKNRKHCSVSARYYYLISSGKEKSNVITASPVGFSNNKVAKTKDGKLMRKEPLQPLSVMIKQLLDMNPGERKKIAEFLKLIE